MVIRLVFYLLLSATAWPADQAALALPTPPSRQWVNELFNAWKAPVPPRQLVDPAGWRELIAAAEQAYRDQLRLEQALSGK